MIYLPICNYAEYNLNIPQLLWFVVIINAHQNFSGRPSWVCAPRNSCLLASLMAAQSPLAAPQGTPAGYVDSIQVTAPARSAFFLRFPPRAKVKILPKTLDAPTTDGARVVMHITCIYCTAAINDCTCRTLSTNVASDMVCVNCLNFISDCDCYSSWVPC